MVAPLRSRRALTGVLSALSLFLPAVAGADVTTLTASRDNTLIETPVGNSNGSGDGIYAGRVAFLGGGTRRRAVLAFDVSSIPGNATIDSAYVTLAMVGTSNPADQVVTMHRLSPGDWGEGGSIGGGQGGAAQPGEATWLYRAFSTTPWTSPGGDFAASASATQTVGDLGTYVWSGAGLAADVQAWVATPASNAGWLLLGGEATEGTVKKFSSRNGLTAPELRVAWSVSNTGVGAPPRAGAVWFAPPTPSPATGPVRLSYTLPRAARVSLSVHDAAGRLVRRLTPVTAAAAGRHDVTWDGLGESGARAASGVYLATLTVDGVSYVRRVPVLQ